MTGRRTRPPLTAAQQKAEAACASLRPAGGFGGGFGAGRGGGAFNANSPAFQKFEACLSQHGVQVGAGADRSSPAFQTALAACRSLLPQGAFGGGAGGAAPGGAASGSGANPSTFAAFQACLRQHGIQPGAASGTSSAKTQAALAACQKLLAKSGAGSTTTSSTTTTG